MPTHRFTCKNPTIWPPNKLLTFPMKSWKQHAWILLSREFIKLPANLFTFLYQNLSKGISIPTRLFNTINTKPMRTARSLPLSMLTLAIGKFESKQSNRIVFRLHFNIINDVKPRRDLVNECLAVTKLN